MAQQTDSQLLELFQFLADPQAPVRRIALATLLPYTAPDAPERKLFLRDSHVEQIATMCADNELIAHDAISALINLSSMLEVVQRLHKLPGFVTGLVRLIVDEKALLSDLACMLLSNMSKFDSVSRQILGLRVPVGSKASTGEGEAAGGTEGEDEIAALDLLLEVFLRGEGKKYNPNANYDFLASVFANVSLLPQGRAFLLATPDRSVEPPLAKIISFTEHPSTIRRGGVASTIKNAAFEKAGHTRLVAPSNDGPAEEGCIDLLVQLLLPLCGNEEFDIDVLDELPAELQLLPSDKTRESDPQIRTILVETLVLLATNRSNREAMRKRGVYPVIKEAHSKEAVPAVKEAMVRLVNLLMRDEGPETALEEVDAQTDPADLPPAPSFENNSNFVQHQEAPAEEAKGEEEVKEVVEQREAQEEKEDERPQHHNVPLSRMQPEEDEEEMLLEV
ncbi:Protein HGH1 [Rhodotorula toruloides]|nr:Protein HGH1 [Rhodotorula toruloides]